MVSLSEKFSETNLLVMQYSLDKAYRRRLISVTTYCNLRFYILSDTPMSIDLFIGFLGMLKDIMMQNSIWESTYCAIRGV